MVGECWWWNVGLYESLRTYVLIGDIVMETCYLFHVYQYMNAPVAGMERLYILTHQNVFMLLFTCGGQVA
jgi:hypothetical protein